MHPIPETIAPQIKSTLYAEWNSPHVPRWRCRAALCVSLGFYGLRRNEARELLRRDLDETGCILYVRTQEHGTPRRIILHPDFAARIAGTWHAVRPKHLPHNKRRSPYSFVTQWGNPVRRETQQRRVSRYLKPWGAYSRHSMGHTPALRVWAETENILAVVRLLGHKTLRQTHLHLQTIIHVPITAGPSWPTPTTPARPTILRLHRSA